MKKRKVLVIAGGVRSIRSFGDRLPQFVGLFASFAVDTALQFLRSGDDVIFLGTEDLVARVKCGAEKGGLAGLTGRTFASIQGLRELHEALRKDNLKPDILVNAFGMVFFQTG